MSSMMQTMHDPVYREKIEQKMAGLKSDPELSNIMQELEGGGPAAMMKCTLSTLSEQALACISLCCALKDEAPCSAQHLWHSASLCLQVLGQPKGAGEVERGNGGCLQCRRHRGWGAR